MSRAPSPLHQLVRQERRRQRMTLVGAALSAALVAAASVALLGLSGWFIAGAAAAGLGGKAVALTFNYLLPSAAIRFLAIVRTLARYGERLLGHQAAFRALARIRPALFQGLAAAPPQEALALSSGQASARLVQDVDAVETLFVGQSAPWAAAAALGAGLAMTALAGPLAMAALAVVLITLVASTWALARRVSAAPGQRAQQAAGRLKDAYSAYAAAAPELVCYGFQDQAITAIMAHDAELAQARRQAAVGEGLLMGLQALAGGVVVALIIAAAETSSIPLAALSALAGAVALEGASGLARVFERAGAVEEAARRLDPLLAPRLAASQLRPASTRLTIQRGTNTVSVSPPDRLALSGVSGAGKTTLLEQLLALRPDPGDAIRIDGQPVRELSEVAVRGLFAYAPQDARLVSGTVRDNLKLAAPNATDDEFWSVLRDAALDDRVRALPGGLDCWIGDAGERLSGGERRRLALARVCLRDAAWLLLDEPTEGLDAATEAVVLDRLGQRLERTGQGLILVSHRPAPLRLCDRQLSVS